MTARRRQYAPEPITLHTNITYNETDASRNKNRKLKSSPTCTERLSVTQNNYVYVYNKSEYVCMYAPNNKTDPAPSVFQMNKYDDVEFKICT